MNNIIDFKDFDINKINIDEKYIESQNCKNLYITNLKYDNDTMPLINLNDFNVNQNVILPYNNVFNEYKLSKNRYCINLYTSMIQKDKINEYVELSNKLNNLIKENENIKNILNKLNINDTRCCPFYLDYNIKQSKNDYQKLNHLKVFLPYKDNGNFDGLKIYKKIKDNDIVEINNIKNICDLEELLNIKKYSKLILTPFVRIKYLWFLKSNSFYNIGFKFFLEKLIIDYTDINNSSQINYNDYTDLFIDKSDYPNDFYNLYNIKVKNYNISKYNELKYNEPKQNEPKYIEPKQNEPKYIEPKYIEPKYIEPKYNEPKQNEPNNNINVLTDVLNKDKINMLFDIINERRKDNIIISITDKNFVVKITK